MVPLMKDMYGGEEGRPEQGSRGHCPSLPGRGGEHGETLVLETGVGRTESNSIYISGSQTLLQIGITCACLKTMDA